MRWGWKRLNKYLLVRKLGFSAPSGASQAAKVPSYLHTFSHPLQVLGRNLEAVVNAAMELQTKWGDQFVSVEHLVLALADDVRFGAQLVKQEGITKDQLDKVRRLDKGGKRARAGEGRNGRGALGVGAG